MATAPAANAFPALPLALIRISPLNPRKRFDPGKLKELTESIRQDGVLEPILVRPVEAATDGSRYEIVAGERRFRAATEAQLGEIPAIVRELTDAKALELALVENVMRSDLNPLEEGQGYDRLLKEHGYAVDDLAGKTGKSRSYIHARLKLVGLPEVAKKALWAEKINASVALLIARIPDAKLQTQATKEILAGHGSGEPMTLRAAARHVQDRYMLSLASAPFPTADEALVPSAGSCAACPKRTGNNPDLFGDVSRGDVCTDPGCFAEKKAAGWQRVQLEASHAGQPVLGDDEARKLFGHGGRLNYGAPYVDLDSAYEQDAKSRTWRKLLGKHAPKTVLARDGEGAVHTLARRAEAEAALKTAGHRFQNASEAEERRVAAMKKEEAARRRRLETLRRSSEEAVGALVARVEAQEPPAKFWRVLLDGIVSGSWHEVVAAAVKRRGWAEKKVRPEEVLTRHAADMDAAQLRGLLLELTVTRGAFTTWGTPGFGKTLAAACDAFGVDLKKIEAGVKAGMDQKAAGKAKSKPKR